MAGFHGDGDGPRNLDEELARKVALQKQMLEHERQKEALGYQQSLLLQQQQQQQQQQVEYFMCDLHEFCGIEVRHVI